MGRSSAARRPIIGGDSLSRFFALHVFVIPGTLLFFLALHLWLVLKCGVSAPPVPGQLVDPKTYDSEYHEELKSGVPFLGDAVLKDILFSSLAVICGRRNRCDFGPKGPTGPPILDWWTRIRDPNGPSCGFLACSRSVRPVPRRLSCLSFRCW